MHSVNGMPPMESPFRNFASITFSSSLAYNQKSDILLSLLMLLCYVNGLSVCYFFLQINSNGRELKLMTSDQKIVRVSLAETVSLIFMSCSAILIQAWAAHALCPLICCKCFRFPLSDFQGHLLF